MSDPGALLVAVGGETRLFEQAFTAGRDREGHPPCGLSADDEYLSCPHAEFAPVGDGWVVRDLGSTNGTWIGQERVYDWRLLAKGDQVRIGRTVLTVVPL